MKFGENGKKKKWKKNPLSETVYVSTRLETGDFQFLIHCISYLRSPFYSEFCMGGHVSSKYLEKPMEMPLIFSGYVEFSFSIS